MTGLTEDRTVHAEHNGLQIVRYDKAGKWYVEHADLMQRSRWTRAHVSVTEAARLAREWRAGGGRIHIGLLGGSAFDRKVQS